MQSKGDRDHLVIDTTTNVPVPPPKKDKEPIKEEKPLTDREKAEKELHDSYNEDDYDMVIDLEWD